MILKMGLLDMLAVHANCDYLSDLPHLDIWQKMRLARVLENISADTATLREWNDALEYLTGANACINAEQARAALIAGLSWP